MQHKSPRVAVRAVIVENKRLLLVNAWPKGRGQLMCAPGGGVIPGTSLPENLKREVREETGLTVTVGAPCLVNEFHDPRSGFHQVEIFFHCAVVGSAVIAPDWQDPEHIVSEHHWVQEARLSTFKFKPDSLGAVAFAKGGNANYDLLEAIVP